MACANVAGAAALATEYLRTKSGLNPGAALLRSVLIGAADPLPSGSVEPNTAFGFGQINLGRHLPFSDSLYRLLVNDSVAIEHGSHLVAHIVVNNISEELRITIAFLDQIGCLDGIFPWVGELALIVESPSHNIWRGNYQRGKTAEEHFSTTQRVIVLPSDIEPGQWSIHVIADLLPEANFTTVSFSAAVRGSIVTEALQFSQTGVCVTDCGNGTCNNASGQCQCPTNTLGQSCQLPILTIHADNVPHEFGLGPRENQYIAVEKTAATSGMIGLEVAMNRGLALHVFSVQGVPPSAFPREYDRPHWGVQHVSVVWHHSGQTAETDALMIHNPAAWEVSYRVQAWFETPPTDSPKSRAAVGLIVGVSVGSVTLVIAIVLGVVCYRRRRVPHLEDMSEPMIEHA
jgi:hypothetical protein